SQFRLLFLDRFEPGMVTYNIPAAVRLQGMLDVEALRKSLQEIVRRHEALRTNFAFVDGRPVQQITPPSPFDLPLIVLEHLPAGAREEEMLRLARVEVRRPFDLAQDLKLRAALLRLDEQEHVLVFTMHHIASDGWSLGIFLRELAIHYAAFAAGQEPPLPDLPVQYADYAHWQQEWLGEEGALADQLAYWQEQLG